MASSRPIAAGEEYTPDDINNLRSDVLDSTSGHKHDGSDGAKVPFANLDVVGAAGSTAPSGGAKSYNDLANHVAGNQGSHGLNASVYVLGAPAAGWMIQAGPISDIPHLGDNPPYNYKTVTFPIAFSGTPYVVVTSNGAPDGWASLGYNVTDVNATSFKIGLGHHSPSTASYMAMGPKAP